jgi:hypothetical protein
LICSSGAASGTARSATLDLDLVVAVEIWQRSNHCCGSGSRWSRSRTGLNVPQAGSKLRVQFQTDPRYEEFPGRAPRRDEPGVRMSVAAIEDVLQGKIRAERDLGTGAEQTAAG